VAVSPWPVAAAVEADALPTDPDGEDDERFPELLGAAVVEDVVVEVEG
jgi:hypothetical protein